MFRSIKRPTAVIAAALVALLSVGAAVALAHVAFVSSSPRNGAVLNSGPRSVSITFSGPIRSGSLKVVGPRGIKESIGSGGRDPRNVDRLLVRMKSHLPAGKYTAYGSTIAQDTHHQSWKLSFRVK